MDAHPDFGAPDPLAPLDRRVLVAADGVLMFSAPAKSVLLVELRE